MKTGTAWLIGLVSGTLLLGCGEPPELGDDPTAEEVTVDRKAVSGLTEPSANEVLVCEGANYSAYCHLMPVGFWAFSVGVRNDTMSSVKVGSSVRLTLCEHGEYQGTCQTFSAGGRITNLGFEPIGNDRVSSLRVVPTTTPDCRAGALPPAPWAFFYRDPFGAGDCVALAAGTYANPAEMGIANDSISSHRSHVPRQLSICNHVNLGQCRHFPTGSPNIDNYSSISFDNTVSSISLF